MSWLDALGWAGSALLVFSLAQARVLRFRVLNLAACLILVVFNWLLGIWPMVAMNVVLSGINLWFIRKLLTTRHDAATYEVLEVGPNDEYLRRNKRLIQLQAMAWAFGGGFFAICGYLLFVPLGAPEVDAATSSCEARWERKARTSSCRRSSWIERKCSQSTFTRSAFGKCRRRMRVRSSGNVRATAAGRALVSRPTSWLPRNSAAARSNA